MINNIKEKDTHRGTLFYCTADKALSKVDLLKEFACLTFGVPNLALGHSQKKAAIALQRLPLKHTKKVQKSNHPSTRKTQPAHAAV